MRRRKDPPWFHNFLLKMRLEGHAFEAHPSLKGRKLGKGLSAEYVYEVTLDVPGYEARRVRLAFAATRKVMTPDITVDGPSDSPHRYSGENLCVWHPRDTEERRWVPSDGLRALIDMVAIHLFKEAWWRETGEWLGDEHPHEPVEEAA